MEQAEPSRKAERVRKLSTEMVDGVRLRQDVLGPDKRSGHDKNAYSSATVPKQAESLAESPRRE